MGEYSESAHYHWNVKVDKFAQSLITKINLSFVITALANWIGQHFGGNQGNFDFLKKNLNNANSNLSESVETLKMEVLCRSFSDSFEGNDSNSIFLTPRFDINVYEVKKALIWRKSFRNGSLVKAISGRKCKRSKRYSSCFPRAWK